MSMPEYTNDYHWQQTHPAGKGGGLTLATDAGISQN
jgi:hypothetical protein